MSTATVTKKGQIVIPADIRARYGLTPGTHVEIVDDGGGIRLLLGRRVPKTDPAAGFGLIKIKRAGMGRGRKMSDFNAAKVLGRRDKIKK